MGWGPPSYLYPTTGGGHHPLPNTSPRPVSPIQPEVRSIRPMYASPQLHSAPRLPPNRRTMLFFQPHCDIPQPHTGHTGSAAQTPLGSHRRTHTGHSRSLAPHRTSLSPHSDSRRAPQPHTGAHTGHLEHHVGAHAGHLRTLGPHRD